MGLLDKLWDDVVAGPQPDRGLGRLRRTPPLPEGSIDAEPPRRIVERRRSLEFARYGDELLRDPRDRRRSIDFIHEQDEARRVTQSISITKRPPLLRLDSLDPDYGDTGSTPSTPGAANTPGSSYVGSPFSSFEREKGTSVPSSPAFATSAREKDNGWSSVFSPGGGNKVMRKFASDKFEKQAPNSPTVYDWVVLSALDR